MKNVQLQNGILGTSLTILRGDGSVVRKRVAKKNSTALSTIVTRKFLLLSFFQLYRKEK